MLVFAGAAACTADSYGGEAAGGQTPSPTPAQEIATAPAPAFAPIASLTDQYPQFFDEVSGLSVVLGTPDLGVGRQRVAIAFANQDGLIKLPVARVESYYYPNGPGAAPEGPVETVSARYFDFPLGVRGVYVADLEFTQAGAWGIEVSVPGPEGGRVGLLFDFEVAPDTKAPSVGDRAPATRNRTLRDVASVEQLTTSSVPDPLLYETTIADALESRRPLVLTFASPAFCTNALCGPQVEVLTALREKHAGLAEFVHIDLYENPHEIQGDLERAIRTPILDEWGIESDEWTFVVGADGRVAARFEAFVSESELEEALLAAAAS